MDEWMDGLIRAGGMHELKHARQLPVFSTLAFAMNRILVALKVDKLMIETSKQP